MPHTAPSLFPAPDRHLCLWRTCCTLWEEEGPSAFSYPTSLRGAALLAHCTHMPLHLFPAWPAAPHHLPHCPPPRPLHAISPACTATRSCLHTHTPPCTPHTPLLRTIPLRCRARRAPRRSHRRHALPLPHLPPLHCFTRCCTATRYHCTALLLHRTRTSHRTAHAPPHAPHAPRTPHARAPHPATTPACLPAAHTHCTTCLCLHHTRTARAPRTHTRAHAPHTHCRAMLHCLNHTMGLTAHLPFSHTLSCTLPPSCLPSMAVTPVPRCCTRAAATHLLPLPTQQAWRLRTQAAHAALRRLPTFTGGTTFDARAGAILCDGAGGGLLHSYSLQFWLAPAQTPHQALRAFLPVSGGGAIHLPHPLPAPPCLHMASAARTPPAHCGPTVAGAKAAESKRKVWAAT